MDSKIDLSPSFWKVGSLFPSIYQIEVTNGCNFSCDFCLRRLSKRKTRHLPIEVARKISERDIYGSDFIEFQMSGEPLLHKNLNRILEFFEGKLLIGLSTNGSLIDKQIPALLKLDYLTISVDSIMDYYSIRKGGDFQKLVDNIELILKKRTSKPIIDLQIVEISGYTTERLTQLQEFVNDRKWEINELRTVPDCFIGWLHPEVEIECNELCLNPYFSVSIQADGDVVPCCLYFGKDYVYGNVKEKALRIIWEGRKVEEFRERMRMGGKDTPNFCRRCYMRSPYLLHEQIIKSNFIWRP